MDTHAFFLIIRNEMKLQMRSWVFRFFVVLSLVGVVVCQMYRQGGDDIHWKMVGLPCSIPLVNAYLFSLVQSLFLIVIMSDFPRRLVRSGLRDGVLVRPFGNTLYYWGSLTGVFLSFMAVCLSVMFVVILVVHSVSLAPFRLAALAEGTVPAFCAITEKSSSEQIQSPAGKMPERGIRKQDGPGSAAEALPPAAFVHSRYKSAPAAPSSASARPQKASPIRSRRKTRRSSEWSHE